ncbi:hypothetical protein MSTO_60710 [Mycobacterium stomatepiae]|uniref:Uncharacterized protein n=1 Tax=Mycobacterium stomatepiae TaxID=470076 RepID=A0A7I7QIZ0_9MYCO|nr:hypothetical protein [Mycobacterium stomatepiae]BBY25866.1 hypothetical protein MSTO_60710 [Mycobacterium stomatepiae]
MPLQVHHLRLQEATALLAREATALRPAQMIPAAPVDRAARVVPENTAQVAPVDLKVVPAAPDPMALVGPDIPAAPVSMVRVDLADRVGRVDLADRVGRVALAGRGTGIRTADTSTTRHGATDLPLGVRVNRLGRRGIDPSRRQGARGTMARSTTGATRKLPCGIPVSTPGASGSSESGFRCK